MQLTRDNVIWFSGLFEGEGCITCHLPSDKKTPRWGMMLNMTDHDVVQKIHNLFGGKLYFRKSNNPKHKDKTEWQTYNHKLMYALCAAMIPFMGERRSSKMISFIKDFSSRPATNSEMVKSLWRDPVWRANQVADRKARRGINVKGLKKQDYLKG